MKPGYDLYSWFINGLPSERALRLTDAILKNHGASLDEDCVLVLDDWGDQVSSADLVDDPETALARLVSWPTLGSIEYHLEDVSVFATFHPGEDSARPKVVCIQLSVSSDWFDRVRPTSEQAFESIARELHLATMADRTVMSWSGRPPDVVWHDELLKLQAGILEGKHDVDLRRSS